MLHVIELLTRLSERSRRAHRLPRHRMRFAGVPAIVQHALGALLCLTLAQGVQGVAHALDGGAPNADGGMDASSGGDGGPVALDSGVVPGVGDGGGSGTDAMVPMDAGGGPPLTAACSCETNSGVGAREIHLCTGSFERQACRRFSCGNGTLRSASCDRSSPVRLCCDMKSRDLYTNLYEDCTHPNCESGFRAQCADFAGEVLAGPCGSPDGDEDPNTELGEEASCSVTRLGAEHAITSGFGLSLLALGLLIRRRSRSTSLNN